MTTPPRHILVDFDDTLTSTKHRQSLIHEQGWDAFHEAAPDDSPIRSIIGLINVLAVAGYTIVAITGRPEKYRQMTTAQALTHDIRIHHLLMRPDDDYSPTAQCKLKLARNHFNSDEGIRAEVILILDDNQSVIEAFKAIGITALQVHPQ